jgi:hypothetical protein
MGSDYSDNEGKGCGVTDWQTYSHWYLMVVVWYITIQYIYDCGSTRKPVHGRITIIFMVVRRCPLIYWMIDL